MSENRKYHLVPEEWVEEQMNFNSSKDSYDVARFQTLSIIAEQFPAVEVPNDEDIDKDIPVNGYLKDDWNVAQRIGAKWLRDKLFKP